MGELSTLGLRCKQYHILDYFKQLILVSNENQIFCINFIIIQISKRPSSKTYPTSSIISKRC